MQKFNINLARYPAELGNERSLGITAIFKLSIHHSHTSHYNNQQLVNSSCTFPQDIEHELEKARLLLEQKDKLLEQKDKEIGYLKEIIELQKQGMGKNEKNSQDG